MLTDRTHTIFWQLCPNSVKADARIVPGDRSRPLPLRVITVHNQQHCVTLDYHQIGGGGGGR
jgi:hypothetical protein